MSNQDMNFIRSLSSIGTWIERNGSAEFFPVYGEPASPEAIGRAEQAIGMPFHPSLHALLRFSNGMTDHAPSLIDAFKLMTVDEIVSAYLFLSGEFPDGENLEWDDHPPMRAAKGVQAVWWCAKWIPFMQNGGGDYLCVDMDPARAGSIGQVVTYYHDETFRPKVANDIGQMFARVAEGLVAGTYKLDPENQMISRLR